MIFFDAAALPSISALPDATRRHIFAMLYAASSPPCHIICHAERHVDVAAWRR